MHTGQVSSSYTRGRGGCRCSIILWTRPNGVEVLGKDWVWLFEMSSSSVDSKTKSINMQSSIFWLLHRRLRYTTSGCVSDRSNSRILYYNYYCCNNRWTRASISAQFEIQMACSIASLMMYSMIYFFGVFLVCLNDSQLSPIARTAMHDGAGNPARYFCVYAPSSAFTWLCVQYMR